MTRTAKAERRPHRRASRLERREGDARAEMVRWIERGEEVTALFECALRGCILGDRDVAERSVYELMRALEPQGRRVGKKVFEHFDSCLSDLADGEFEDAFEALSTLRDYWVEALTALRRDCDRADRLH